MIPMVLMNSSLHGSNEHYVAERMCLDVQIDEGRTADRRVEKRIGDSRTGTGQSKEFRSFRQNRFNSPRCVRQCCNLKREAASRIR